MTTSCVPYTLVFIVKQKTANEVRISDWSPDVCSSDLAVSWQRLADQCITLLRPLAADRMVTLTAEPAVEGAAFYADERLAKQMLVNLLSNGVKYTPSGGAVQFGITLAPDGSAVVSVQDTGVGMTEADQIGRAHV